MPPLAQPPPAHVHLEPPAPHATYCSGADAVACCQQSTSVISHAIASGFTVAGERPSGAGRTSAPRLSTASWEEADLLLPGSQAFCRLEYPRHGPLPRVDVRVPNVRCARLQAHVPRRQTSRVARPRSVDLRAPFDLHRFSLRRKRRNCKLCELVVRSACEASFEIVNGRADLALLPARRSPMREAWGSAKGTWRAAPSRADKPAGTAAASGQQV